MICTPGLEICNITQLMKKLPILLLFCISCSVKPHSPAVQIALINNGQSVKIIGFDKMILDDIAHDSTNNFESLVPVYRMPADTDMKDYQPVQPGKYLVKDSALIFTPDTPFVKHQTYFMRYYQYGGGNSVWDFVKGKKTASKLRYTDLIFKQ